MQINIKNLEFDTIIGLLPFEREKPQTVILHCSLEYPYTKECFLDYATLRSYLKETMIQKGFEKLEEAILFLNQGIKERYPFIHWIELEIIKPHIFDDCQVSLKQKVVFNHGNI